MKKRPGAELELVSDKGETVEHSFLGSVPQLRGYIRKILPGARYTDDIEDIMQEVFLRAYSAKKKEKLAFARAYLFRIARNVSFDRYKNLKKNLEVVVEDFVLDRVIDDVGSQEDILIERERLKSLNDAMASLPPKCRTAFFLRHFEGLSHREIAKAMAISTSTVEKHLAKALYMTMEKMTMAESEEDGDVRSRAG